MKANEKHFRKVKRGVMDVIEAVTNSKIKYDEGEVVIDVCQAIQEIRKEERQIEEMNKAKETTRNFY